MYGSCSAYLSLMETRKSLGVEENSSKLAMSSCFTWMGSQSSMMNLRENEKKALKKKLASSGDENKCLQVESVDRKQEMQAYYIPDFITAGV